jgi:hypothetical protein
MLDIPMLWLWPDLVPQMDRARLQISSWLGIYLSLHTWIHLRCKVASIARDLRRMMLSVDFALGSLALPFMLMMWRMNMALRMVRVMSGMAVNFTAVMSV